MQPINFNPDRSISPEPKGLRVMSTDQAERIQEAATEFDPTSHAVETRYQANIGKAKLLMGLGGNQESVEQLENVASVAAIIADPNLIITNANQVASQLESQGENDLATRIRDSVQS